MITLNAVIGVIEQETRHMMMSETAMLIKYKRVFIQTGLLLRVGGRYIKQTLFDTSKISSFRKETSSI